MTQVAYVHKLAGDVQYMNHVMGSMGSPDKPAFQKGLDRIQMRLQKMSDSGFYEEEQSKVREIVDGVVCGTTGVHEARSQLTAIEQRLANVWEQLTKG